MEAGAQGEALARRVTQPVGDNEVLLGQKYIVSRQALGQGAFGAVVVGRDAETPAGETPKKFAIKKIPIAVMLRNPEEELQRHVKTEIGIMRIIRHPNVVHLEDAFYSDHNLYLVLELCTGGDFFSLISCDPQTGKGGGAMAPNDARKYFQQLMSGVQYCHERGIAHRDLKPENLLLDQDKNLKICDFGLSTIKKAQAQKVTQTQCGTPNYVSPEILHTDGIYSADYDPYKADIWTCGVLLYVFLTGCLPFDDANLGRLYSTIKSARYKFPAGIIVSKGARTLVQRILDPVPETRITIAEIREDTWFKVGISKQPLADAVEEEEVEEEEDDSVNAFELLGAINAFTGLSSSSSHKYTINFTTPMAASAFEPMLTRVLQDSFGVELNEVEDEAIGQRKFQCTCSIADASPTELKFDLMVLKLLDEVCVVAWNLIEGEELVFYNSLYVPVCTALGPDRIQGEMPTIR